MMTCFVTLNRSVYGLKMGNDFCTGSTDLIGHISIRLPVRWQKETRICGRHKDEVVVSALERERGMREKTVPTAS